MNFFDKTRNFLKSKFELKRSVLNALPFWAGAFISGRVAVLYAKIFSWLELGTQLIYEKTSWAFFFITPANIGDKVLFITSRANRDTRIHLIGGHADLVCLGGSFNDKLATNYESWPVVAGSAVAIIYQFRQPGTYAYFNHNLIEAFSFGAVAQVKVDGKWDDNLMKKISKQEKNKSRRLE